MFPSDSQGGNSFGSQGDSFGGGFGEGPPADDSFGQSPFDDGFGFDEQSFLSALRLKNDVIGIGLHFHEKLRKMR